MVEALAVVVHGGSATALVSGIWHPPRVWMKKGRELLVGSYRRLHQNTIHSSPTHFHQTMSHSDPPNRYSYSPSLHWNPQLHQYFLNAYGADHFSRISAALTYAPLLIFRYFSFQPIISRNMQFQTISDSTTEHILLVVTVWFSLSFPIRSRPSRYSCIRVNTLRSGADAVIEKLRPLVSNVSVAVQSEFEDGESNPLKECLEDASAPFSKCKIPGLDYVVFVWGSGPHRIGYGEAPPKEVIVSRKCAEAVLRGAQVSNLFANFRIMCFEVFDWLLLMLVLALGIRSGCDGLQCSCWERRYSCGFGCCGAAGCWWGLGNSHDTWHCSPRIRDR